MKGLVYLPQDHNLETKGIFYFISKIRKDISPIYLGIMMNVY